MEPWKPSSFGVSFVLALASLASRAEEHAQAGVGAGRVTPPPASSSRKASQARTKHAEKAAEYRSTRERSPMPRSRTGKRRRAASSGSAKTSEPV